MKRWECDHCDFIAWTGSHDTIEEMVKSHLLAHYSDNLTRSDFRINWTCPYCSAKRTTYEQDVAVGEFKTHLYEHVSGSVIDSTHLADQLSWNGNLQVNGPVEGAGSDMVRTHFHAAADLIVLITSTPEARVRLLYETLDEWPTQTVIISTNGYSFDETAELDFSGIPIELVEIDASLGPKELGETFSRVLDIHQTPEMRVSVELSNLQELIQSSELQLSCEFVRMLSSRLDAVDSVLQLYVAPDQSPRVATALNLLSEEIDFTVAVEDEQITRDK